MQWILILTVAIAIIGLVDMQSETVSKGISIAGQLRILVGAIPPIIIEPSGDKIISHEQQLIIFAK